MKRLNTPAAAARLEKRLVLNRETLRRLGAEDLEKAAGGSVLASCGDTCNCTTKKQQNMEI